mgnify:CR=1 FL=1
MSLLPGRFLYNATMADQDSARVVSGIEVNAEPIPRTSAEASGTEGQAPAKEPAEVVPSRGALIARSHLLDIAKSDSATAMRTANLRRDFKLRANTLNTAVPEKYLALVDLLRSAVNTFNGALVEIKDKPIPHIKWTESPNVALREPAAGDGMRVRIERQQSSFELILRFVNRSGQPPVPLIEGAGLFGRDPVNKQKTLIRIEGWIDDGEVEYIISQDFKRQKFALDELPDRIVMAVATHDLQRIPRFIPTSSMRKPPTDEEAQG